LLTLQARHGFQRPYLKLDTQGHDLEVIRGAGDTLSSTILALQTEASVIGIYQGMPGYIQAIQVLNERGFEITTLQPVARDRLLRVVEFDCVMRNMALAKFGALMLIERLAPALEALA
jgi:hypothetical protein